MARKRPASSMDGPGKRSVRIPKSTPSRHDIGKQAQVHTIRNRQRQHRLALGGNTTNQKTLTQIDFVRQITTPQDILGDLDFQEIEDDETFDDDALDATPKIEAVVPEQRKYNNGKKYQVKKGMRKGNSRDRTLTQMVNTNVSERRSLKSTRSPRKRPAWEMEPIAEESEDETDDTHPRKKLQLERSHNTKLHDVTSTTTRFRSISPKQEDGTSAKLECKRTERGMKPVTPQKPRRFIVPSSQSPDSPEITFNTPHKATNSPVPFPLNSTTRKTASKKSPPNSSDRLSSLDWTKDEASSPAENITESQLVIGDSFATDHEESDIPCSTPTPPLSPVRPISAPTDSLKTEIRYRSTLDKANHEPNKPFSNSRNHDPNIVYETDGDESESYSSQEAVPQTHRNQHKSHSYNPMTTADDHIANYNPSPHSDPEPNPESMDDDVPFSTFRSDMSILYARRPPIYPYEIFYGPENSDVDHTGIAGEAHPITEKAINSNQTEPSLPNVSAATRNYSTRPTNPTTDQADISTQSVTETCEEQQNNNLGSSESAIPCWSSPYIQVEDSQLRQNESEVFGSDTLESHSEPRELLTASQLLTDSLMETIPGPPAWMSSQDNINEDVVN